MKKTRDNDGQDTMKHAGSRQTGTGTCQQQQQGNKHAN